MPTRSQRHLREIQGYDSSGQSALGNAIAVDPSEVGIGDGVVTLQVTGANFAADSVIVVAGTPLTTTFIDDSTLEADLDTDAIAGSAPLQIVVTSASAGTTSAPVYLDVYDEFDLSAPSLTPTAATAGSTITLTVSLGSIVTGTVVVFDGVDQTTVYDSNTQVHVASFSVPATPGDYDVLLRRGTKESMTATFTAQ